MATITAPAVSATSTADSRPHMSEARSCLASSHATSVGTATVSNVIIHSAQASRHHGETAAEAAVGRAWVIDCVT